MAAYALLAEVSDRPGMISYTMTGTDRFGRKASFRPFPDIGSQVYIVD